MPERDPYMRPDDSEIQASTPIKEPLIASDLDTLVPMEELDVESPYSPQETARYKAEIAKLKATLDESDKHNLKQVSTDIRTLLLPLIQREADCFPRSNYTNRAVYLEDTKIQSVFLSSEAKLYIMSYPQDPIKPGQLLPRWVKQEELPVLWIEYADAIINFLTDPRIGQAKRDGEAFYKKHFGSAESSF